MAAQTFVTRVRLHTVKTFPPHVELFENVVKKNEVQLNAIPKHRVIATVCIKTLWNAGAAITIPCARPGCAVR